MQIPFQSCPKTIIKEIPVKRLREDAETMPNSGMKFRIFETVQMLEQILADASGQEPIRLLVAEKDKEIEKMEELVSNANELIEIEKLNSAQISRQRSSENDSNAEAIEQLRAVLKGREQKIGELRTENAKKEEKNRDLQKLLDRESDKRAVLEAESNSQQKQLTKLRERFKDTQTTIDDFKKQLELQEEEAKISAKELQIARRKISKYADDKKDEIDEIMKENDMKLREMETEKDVKFSENSELLKAIAKVESSLKEVENKNCTLSCELQAEKELLQKAEAAEEKARKYIEEFVSESKERESEFAKTIDEVKSEKGAKESECEQLTSEIAELKKQMQTEAENVRVSLTSYCKV